MLDNDIVGSSTADNGTIDLRMFVQGIPTIDNSSEISELKEIGSENDSPAHQLGRFVSEVFSKYFNPDEQYVTQIAA